jgi:hypothetical protein
MKKISLVILIAALGAAANPEYSSAYLYWDDGVMVSGWAWYTGGNYWAVQFTPDFDDIQVNWIGAMTYPDWPDETYQGCYVHVFEDWGGYPGSDLSRDFLQLTGEGEFDWISNLDVISETRVFYIALEQLGNYPDCDSMGVDAVAGTHNWTGYQGSWWPTTLFGDFMLRCCTGGADPDGEWGVEAASWGELKAAYAELEARIRGERATQPDNPRIQPKNDAWRAIRNLY